MTYFLYGLINKGIAESILFGAHQFVLHPIFVLWAWIKFWTGTDKFISDYEDK